MTTYTITLDLPEAIYQHLSRRSQSSRRSVEEELLVLLNLKLPSFTTLAAMPLAYQEVVDFLGRGATAKEIAGFHLSSAAQARASALLEKLKEESLSLVEEAELDLYIELEDFMALVKIQAAQQLQSFS